MPMDKTWRFSKRAAVAAVSLALSAAAQAGNIRGNLDPPAAGGMPAYNGFAIFDVPTSCLDASAGWHSAGNASADCGAISMESATIYLYPGPDPEVTQGTNANNILTWDSSFSSVANILGILVDGEGNVLGIDSQVMGPAAETNPGNYPGRDFFIQFVTGCLGDPICGTFSTDLFALASVAPTGAIGVPDPRAILSDQTGNFSPTLTGGLVFVAVPEPGTASLLLGALGAGWLARRRKRLASG
jgi:hypothetical protein